jgi:hypothetical protein
MFKNICSNNWLTITTISYRGHCFERPILCPLLNIASAARKNGQKMVKKTVMICHNFIPIKSVRAFSAFGRPLSCRPKAKPQKANCAEKKNWQKKTLKTFGVKVLQSVTKFVHKNQNKLSEIVMICHSFFNLNGFIHDSKEMVHE